MVLKPLETFEKCSILFKFKEDENFNRRNTLSILRIKLKLHFVQNVESDTEIGQKGTFFKGLTSKTHALRSTWQRPDVAVFRDHPSVLHPE